MTNVPWKYVQGWNCVACGMCCKGYQVVLGFNEWVNITRKFGIGVTHPDINRFYLGKKGDGSCIFLNRFFNTWFCGLQNMKPKACKLWPFKVYSKPKFGKSNEALYKFGDRNFFIYIDSICVGIRWGPPSKELAYKILPEIVEIALGLRKKQNYSTSRIRV